MMQRKLQREIFLRSFLLQSCWNYERMQNLGFSLCLTPWLRRLYKRGDPAGRDAMHRHLEFFNTQPYMSGFILGVVGNLEESLQDSSRDMRARITSLKSAMGSSLAAVGDKLFWATLKPLCAIFAFGVWLSLKIWKMPPQWIPAAGILSYLILFNTPALSIRWRGIRWGYRWGETIAVEMRKFNWQRHIRQARQVGMGLSIGLAIVAVFSPPFEAKTVLLRTAGLAGCLGIKILRLSVLRSYGLVLMAGILLALSGWQP